MVYMVWETWICFAPGIVLVAAGLDWTLPSVLWIPWVLFVAAENLGTDDNLNKEYTYQCCFGSAPPHRQYPLIYQL